MAVTITFYNHTRKLFANGEVNLANLKLMLLDLGLTSPAAVFDATDTTIDALSANEVDGGGWTTGGEALASAAVTVVNTNEAKLDAADISVTATGVAIGPATHGVIYDDDQSSPAVKNLLFFVDFDGAKTADVGADFDVTFDANGIHLWSAPA